MNCMFLQFTWNRQKNLFVALIAVVLIIVASGWCETSILAWFSCGDGRTHSCHHRPTRRQRWNTNHQHLTRTSIYYTSNIPFDTTTTKCRSYSRTETTQALALTGETISSSSSPSSDVPLGGDYAGIMATFDIRSGALIPIPRQWVPESLLEWDVIPSILEVLVSENDSMRHTATIVPETGCAVDYLETIHNKDTFVFQRKYLWKFSSQEEATTINSSNSPAMIWTSMYQNDLNSAKACVEVCFAIPLEIHNSKLIDRNNYRSRVSIDLCFNKNDGKVWISNQCQIRIFLERQIDHCMTLSGYRPDKNGGLDAQTVTQWLGPILSSQIVQSWANEPHLQWDWNRNTGASPNGPNLLEQVNHTNSDWVIALNLPGNVTIRYRHTGNEKNKKSSSDTDNLDGVELEIGQVYPHAGLRQVVLHSLYCGTNNANPYVCDSDDNQCKVWVEAGIWGVQEVM